MNLDDEITEAAREQRQERQAFKRAVARAWRVGLGLLIGAGLGVPATLGLFKLMAQLHSIEPCLETRCQNTFEHKTGSNVSMQCPHPRHVMRVERGGTTVFAGTEVSMWCTCPNSAADAGAEDRP